MEATINLKSVFGLKSHYFFIRSLLGLDHQAVQGAFSEYLQGSTYNEKKICFVEILIHHFKQNGVLEVAHLYEPSFNQIHYEGIEGVFSEGDADNIFGVIEAFKEAQA